VPESITPYQHGAAKLLHDANILQPLIIYPKMSELKKVAQEVGPYLDTQEGRQLLFSPHKSRPVRIHSEKFWYMQRRTIERTTRIHLNKFDPDFPRKT